jgi:hypothetical protein
VGVWHFTETVGHYADSSKSGMDSVSETTASRDQAGKAGRSVAFDGTAGQRVTTGTKTLSALNGKPACTVSALAYLNAYQGTAPNIRVICSDDEAHTNLTIHLRVGVPDDSDIVFGCVGYGDRDAVSGGEFPLNAWSHVAQRWKIGAPDSSNELFLDGTSVAQANNSVEVPIDPTTTGELQIGDNRDFNRTWDGFIDELRISDTDRSGDWLKAEWLNMVSNQAFQSFGDVENLDGGGPRGSGTAVILF